MTIHMFDSEESVNELNARASSLPKNCKLQVLEHLLGEFENTDLADLSEEARKKLLSVTHSVPESNGPVSAPTIIIPSNLSKIEKILGKNFHGSDSWASLQRGDVDPDLSAYPRLTPEFLEEPFEYSPDFKRCEAGILAFTRKGENFKSFLKLTEAKCYLDQREPAFSDDCTIEGITFSGRRSERDGVIFVMKDGVLNLPNEDFEASQKRILPGFSVVDASSLAMAIGMHYMDTGERIYRSGGATTDTVLTERADENHRVRIFIHTRWAGEVRRQGICTGMEDLNARGSALALRWDLESL